MKCCNFDKEKPWWCLGEVVKATSPSDFAGYWDNKNGLSDDWLSAQLKGDLCLQVVKHQWPMNRNWE